MKRRVYVIAAALAVLALILTACGGGGDSGQAFEWPDSAIGKLLPATDAKAKELSFDEDYISATLIMDQDEYRDYVKACREAGFTVNESSSDSSDYSYFDAENKDGYALSLSYDEDGCMLSLYAPDDEEEAETEDADTDEEDSGAQEDTSSDSAPDADFKKTMDEYEKFMNDYVDFMKKYEDSDDITAMAEDYSKMISRYSKFEEKIDAIDEDDLSTEDYAYYTEVMARVTKKLGEL